MESQAYYQDANFWLGLAVGLAILAARLGFCRIRLWALRRVKRKLAKRVSTNFVVAGEIFRVLRLPSGSQAHLTIESLSTLVEKIEGHAEFFSTLLEDQPSFCLFFGDVYARAFEEIARIYRDYVDQCARLIHALSIAPTERRGEVAAGAIADVIVGGADPQRDLTFFRLSRAVSLIDAACRPALDHVPERFLDFSDKRQSRGADASSSSSSDAMNQTFADRSDAQAPKPPLTIGRPAALGLGPA